MYVTKNAIFLHIPKTAGTWIKKILEPITLNQRKHGILFSKPQNKEVFVFTRNPWDWYVSQYEFNKNGSDIMGTEGFLYEKITHKDFSEWIHLMNNPSYDFKNKMYNYSRLFVMLNRKTVNDVNKYVPYQWLTNDVSVFQNYYNVFTKYATYVGKQENIRKELVYMLDRCSELTNEIESSILKEPPLNVTISKKNYRDYYTDELMRVVEMSNGDIIKKYQYEF